MKIDFLFIILPHISIAFVNCAVVHNVKVSWLPPNTTKAPEVTSESTTKFAKIEEKSEVNSTSVLNEKSSTSLPQRIAGQFLVRMINEIQEKHRQQAFKRGTFIKVSTIPGEVPSPAKSNQAV